MLGRDEEATRYAARALKLSEHMQDELFTSQRLILTKLATSEPVSKSDLFKSLTEDRYFIVPMVNSIDEESGR